MIFLVSVGVIVLSSITALALSLFGFSQPYGITADILLCFSIMVCGAVPNHMNFIKDFQKHQNSKKYDYLDWETKNILKNISLKEAGLLLTVHASVMYIISLLFWLMQLYA